MIIPAREGWQAELALSFAEIRDGGGGNGDGRGATILARRAHRGPLAVQRPFFPEGPRVCHVYLLHPPGGLVGGDSLQIDVTVGAGAHALCTTPAATKAYRTAGPRAAQAQALVVEADATLEWLPQETIVFDGADVDLSTRIDLAHGSRAISLDLVCFGLPARAEPFARGRCRQRFELWRAGTPLVIDRARWEGGGEALTAAWGLGGAPVLGTLVAAPAPAPADAADVIETLRARAAALPSGDRAGVTIVGRSEGGGAISCRYIGHSVERGRAFLHEAWSALRPSLLQRASVAPRIWAT